jgi:PadR family transcriptional regulator, regulatory protein PadR
MRRRAHRPDVDRSRPEREQETDVRIGKDLVAASATPLVLGILAEGESYGYAILKRIMELSGGRIEWTDGMLYPLLHRLERLGHVESTWRVAESGRRRKHYRLTDRGQATLSEQHRQWDVVTDALRRVWHDATIRDGAPGGRLAWEA